MLLHKLYPQLRCKEVRRDVADPYQMHATICRVFSGPHQRCPPGEFLWRLERETDEEGNPCLIVQSRSAPSWSRIGINGWIANEKTQSLDLVRCLQLETLAVDRKFRFRLRANPCVSRDGKRIGLFKSNEQEEWLKRKSILHGFEVSSVVSSQEQMLRGDQHGKNTISVFSVLFDGCLRVADPLLFRQALITGIGHAKALGLGLLSVAPIK